MASAHQRKAGRAFKAARTKCIRDSSTATAMDRCMSSELKKALGGGRKRKARKGRKGKRRR